MHPLTVKKPSYRTMKPPMADPTAIPAKLLTESDRVGSISGDGKADVKIEEGVDVGVGDVDATVLRVVDDASLMGLDMLK